MRHELRLMIMLVGGMAALCVISWIALVAIGSRTIRTRQDAVAYLLEQHQVRYSDLRLEDVLAGIVGYNSFPDEIHPYIAHITLPDGQEIRGSLMCVGDHGPCDFSLKEAGIDHERAPDLTEVRESPWVAWLDRLTKAIAPW